MFIFKIFHYLFSPERKENLFKLSLEIICGLLVFLFCYTALSKILDIKQYVRDMFNQPFSTIVTWGLIVIVPACEILAAFLLMSYRTRKKGLWFSLCLMTGFTIYIAVVLGGGFGTIPCTCGGVIERFTWKEHLFFNLIFEILIIAGLILQKVLEEFPEAD